MSQVAISGNASGTGVFTIAAPNSNNNYTATLAAGTGTVVLDTLAQTLTNKTLTSPTITGAVVSSMASSVITSGTAVASTSGTSIDFTSIPSWVKRITVMFNGVSTSGTSIPQVQIGSGGYSTTGYNGTFWYSGGGGGTFTTGFGISASAAADLRYGSMILSHMGGNLWVAQGCVGLLTAGITSTTGASIQLAGTLTQLRLTTVNGTDTFDAGSVNILYE